MRMIAIAVACVLVAGVACAADWWLVDDAGGVAGYPVRSVTMTYRPSGNSAGAGTLGRINAGTWVWPVEKTGVVTNDEGQVSDVLTPVAAYYLVHDGVTVRASTVGERAAIDATRAAVAKDKALVDGAIEAFSDREYAIVLGLLKAFREATTTTNGVPTNAATKTAILGVYTNRVLNPNL